MATGAVGSYSAIMRVYLGYAIPIILPLIVMVFVQGTEFHVAMGIMLCLFVVIVISMARNMNKTTVDAIKLKFENADLVDWLGAEKERVDKLNDDLGAEISERRRAEQALGEREAQYRAIFDSAMDGLVIFDRNAGIVEANPEACRMHGYTRDEVIKLTSFDVIHKDYHHIITKFGKEVDSKGYFHDETVNVRKDGSLLSLEVKGTEFDFKGEKHLLAIVRDITERKEFERQLMLAKEEAEAANRAKSDFLARMSHEIRTPMNAILGMAELLQETSLTAEQQDYVKTFSSSGELLLGVINDILDFSKIEAGQIELERIPFDLDELVEDTAKIMSFRAHEKGMELASRVSPMVPTSLIGDPTRLRQILINLMGNAIKFTHDGEVVLEVEKDLERNDPGALKISVRDTGIGIPPEKLEAIFDSFTQADTSTTREFGGTGLGLAISKRLVELMDGSISVESKPGLGAKFSFTARFGVGEASAKPQIAEMSRLQGLRVLVVDDNATNRLIFSEHLTNWGADVTSADGAAPALQALNEAAQDGRPFQLVLSDFNMPNMDGLAFARELKNQKFAAPPVTMMFSSSDTAEGKLMARDVGVASFLVKPIKRQDMLSAILATLGKAAQGADKDWSTVEAEAGLLPPMRILLAEDYLPNRKIVEAFLKRTPVFIDPAENGEIAFRKFTQGRYDAVFMDMEMPIMDGWQATLAIRDWERNNNRPATPIVALTAHAFAEHRRQCLDAGCNDYIHKPVKKKTLFEVLVRLAPADGKAMPVVEAKPVEAPKPLSADRPVYRVALDPAMAGAIDDYIKTVKLDCRNLVEALRNKDLKAIGHIARNLTAGGAGHGLERVSEAGSNISALAAKKDLRGVLDQAKKLNHYIQRVEFVTESGGPASEKSSGGNGRGAAGPVVVDVDEDLVEVIDDYLAELKEDSERIARAFNQKDYEAVFGIGHDLKGSGAGYGIDRITEIGRNICDLVKSENYGPLADEIEALQGFLGSVSIKAK
jgi:PAS domain S-box-containing protein